VVKIRIIIISLLFIVAVNALFAGYSFMSDPTGSGLGAPLSLLRFSPFKNFFIPGLVLFTVNGVFNLVAGTALVLKWRYSAPLLVIQGVFLTGWIVIQVFMLREFNILHAVFGSLGICFCFVGIFLHKKRN
jgi:hypothetical protein